MFDLGSLFGLGDSQEAHRQVYNNEHQGSLTHEVIAGAAGFEAMKAYENHVRRSGQEPSHSLMKEMLAGFAAAEADKLIETKGLDYLDAEKVRHHAKAQAHRLAEEKYRGGNGYEEIINQETIIENNDYQREW
ncbi:hypothetical protein K493DRAFT_318184 [Basidiobolus meristosporus CBS 931.73]|uniref:CipC-like antibiotic response protein n=1 Tax=Basidiobolus meristosporus CBS 931.73 TaxID=1314790 RepID=A0A1Y1XWK1_9FUNG|nr:hypothetical protein K493DRAFT_318184 [Basidiobolus meristosporus CBS 931.73]|eukprot:ORX90103.1 hypothetical protein K493DRAFT_318184 [Basidiobolus meristosporus CBS 931.73]